MINEQKDFGQYHSYKNFVNQNEIPIELPC